MLFDSFNLCWSKKGQGWNGLRSGEKRIRNGMGGNSLEVRDS